MDPNRQGLAGLAGCGSQIQAPSHMHLRGIIFVQLPRKSTSNSFCIDPGVQRRTGNKCKKVQDKCRGCQANANKIKQVAQSCREILVALGQTTLPAAWSGLALQWRERTNKLGVPRITEDLAKAAWVVNKPGQANSSAQCQGGKPVMGEFILKHVATFDKLTQLQ